MSGTSQAVDGVGAAGTPASSAAARRPRGREVEAARNDVRVLAAAREVFAAQGPDAPVAAVAAAAGVGMGSLYRRYGSKDELLQRLCVLSLEQIARDAEVALRDEGDGWTAFERFVRRCVAYRAGAFGAVAGTIPVSEEMKAAAARANRAVEALVERAQHGGGLRADVTSVDVHRLLELFSRGPRGSGPAPDPAAPDATVALDVGQERLLALALDGLRTPSPTALPGPAPEWEAYRSRWRLDGPADDSGAEPTGAGASR